MDATVDLRRQRDAIRHEMEQLVRTMQRLEPDVDQKRPGWEAKRDELAQHRQRLSELRGKMRSVMDAAASVSSSTAANTSALTPPPGAGRQLFSTGASASAAVHQVSPLRRTSISPPREQSPRRYASASGFSASAAAGSGTAHQQITELSAIHRDEKQRLADEVARLTDTMERRHAQERAELENRLQQEELHLREYEMARQRMEEAQRHLEALKRAAQGSSSFSANRSAVPPELEALSARR
ncbi:zinc finger protein, putative [Bodo saltans]|uniref:Zinc finger protein, putative n=1 Tax=Bodo saltans TaxID=75058 RepID=A0A0S4J896_BODSA|nr:zinc finger protein, putative [Bodo saltans]|eukprot:CUG86549.1 zinc finger protein, putative [Bodo saltans]